MNTNIGEMMNAASVLSESVGSPVQQLRKEIDLMRSELVWYESKHPEMDTSKRRARLQRLELICRSLEKCEPIELMPVIRDKLAEARRQDFKPDCACIWLPLQPDVPDTAYAKPAIIDLVGWDCTPHEYEYVGIANAGGFICSTLDN